MCPLRTKLVALGQISALSKDSDRIEDMNILVVYIGEGFGLLIKLQIMLEVSGSKCGCGSKWASVSGRVSSSLRGWQAAQL